MGAVIGQVLTFGLGVAISPNPDHRGDPHAVVARARSTSVGFLLGWLVGIIVPVIIFTALSSFLPESDSGDSHPISGVIKIVLGVLLLVLAVRQWAHRPRDGAERRCRNGWPRSTRSPRRRRSDSASCSPPSTPRPADVDRGRPRGGRCRLPIGQTSVVLLVYLLLAASTVLVPVVGFLIAGDAPGALVGRVAPLADGQQRHHHDDPAACARRRCDRKGLASF